MWNDFKSFLIKQNVVALAIAVVIGTALNALVKSLVADFIMPIVSKLLPSGDWEKATWTIGSIQFGIGDFLAAMLNFLIIGLVAWRISKAFVHPKADSTTVDCRFCRMKIDRSALRCPFCTSDLARAA